MHFDPNTTVLPSVSEIADAHLRRRGRRYGPCPCCGAEQLRDGRGPLAVYPTDTGERWKCHAGGCGKGGGSGALLAAIRFGGVPGRGDPRWRQLFDEYGRRGASAAPNALRGLLGSAARIHAPAPPERAEVAALWGACTPVNAPGLTDGARPMRDWLDGYRGLSADGVARLDMARTMPKSYRWPSWLPTLGLTRDTFLAIYRIAVPTFDASGALVALRFRAVTRWRQPDADGRLRWIPPPGCRVEEHDGKEELVTMVHGERRVLPKSLASRGVSPASGFVLADPMALALLRGGRDDDGVRWDGNVWIVEGEPDLWAVATSRDRLTIDHTGASSSAAFGIESGAWTPTIAARIPDGARVLVWTDHDDQGNEYAAGIAETLAGRCAVERVAPPSTWGGDHVA